MDSKENKQEAVVKFVDKIKSLALNGDIESLSIKIVGESSDELYRLAVEAGIIDTTVFSV